MAYDSYKDDIRKARKRIECVERMIMESEQLELYSFASLARDELERLQKELDKLESMR